MITLIRPANQTVYKNSEFVGKSTDEKPKKNTQGFNLENGDILYCMDTKETFLYSASNNAWIKKTLLPKDYKEIEYIQTTGNAYIFLDVIPNANTKLSITFSTISGNRCIIGCYKSWGPVDAYAIWSHAVAFGNQSLLDLNLYKDGQIHTIEIINGVYYLDGVEFFRYTGDYFESPVPLGVFALNRNGSIYEIIGNMYLYNIEIDGVKFPLCKNTSGEIGIYNPNSKNFLLNKGSGDFIAGPEI